MEAEKAEKENSLFWLVFTFTGKARWQRFRSGERRRPVFHEHIGSLYDKLHLTKALNTQKNLQLYN